MDTPPPCEAANNASHNSSKSDGDNYAVSWIHIVLPLICIIGISGNLLNLVVLTRKRRAGPMQTLERSTNIGLTGLALSDLLFSTVALPYPFLSSYAHYVLPQHAPVLYYRYYSVGCFNLCLMISTYLVMLLAVERYLVTYSPQKAKKLTTTRATTALVLLVYVVCTCATLPYFLNMRVVSCTDIDGRRLLELSQRWSASRHHLMTSYMTWAWPVLAVFGPVCVLLVCNLRLVVGMRSVLQQHKMHSYRVTLILIIIVFMAIILVTPAEVLKLINPYKTWGDAGYLVAAIANILQATNFAFNFMLYCAVDRRFRIMVQELLTPGCCMDRAADAEVMAAIPLQVDQHKTPTLNRTFTFPICKTSTKSSLQKKKIVACT